MRKITDCNQIEFTAEVELCEDDTVQITARWLPGNDDENPFDIAITYFDCEDQLQPEIVLTLGDITKITKRMNKLINEAKLILEVKDHDTTAAGSDKTPSLL